MDEPNIFEIATSELSQDALITWLLQWADEKYAQLDKNLHSCAVKFVQSLIEESPDYKIHSVEAGRQWMNIDVWARVNDKYFIVIEDKKGTSEHSNQLKRYAEQAKNHYKKDMKIVLVYFKMEEQGVYATVEEAGFSSFTRQKMLPILEQYQIDAGNDQKNNILSDYYRYLKGLDEKINSFKTLPIDEWHWYSWKGFFATIQKEVRGNWNYVSNPAGGFLGLWWHWQYKTWNNKKFEFYLQLEYNKLIFKLHVYEPENRREVRDYYRSQLYSVASTQGIDIHQYGRIGTWMGVAKLREDYRMTNESGLINMPATVKNLKKIEELVNCVAAEIDKQ